MNVLGSRLFGSLVAKSISSQVPRYFCAAASNIKDEIDKLVKNSKVVVFMKGTPEEPRCGFSSAVVQVLRMHGVSYDAHNVLERDELRNGIKEYSDWPTIPQVFIGGEFVGGCDIMVKLHQTGDLVAELEKGGIKSALADAVSDSEKKNENA